jgi:hypothetical protein
MYLYINHQARRGLKRVSRWYSCVYLVLTNLLAARTTKTAVEDDEEAQLKALQAELAM